MASRETIDRGWYYVVEPDQGRHAPAAARILAEDGRVLSRRAVGRHGRILVQDDSGLALPVASWLRAAEALPLRAGQRAEVRLAPPGTPATWTGDRLTLDGAWLSAQPCHHPVEAAVASLLTAPPAARAPPRPTGLLPARRALFFESLMNSDLPHNDAEISQGVLHMISTLRGSPTAVVLCNVKMAITGQHRPVQGMEQVARALAEGPVELVAITLLEGYWHGVCSLIAELRRLGCRAHIAVGGVMPTLSPEHVAAHLPGVSFVCRGAGEAFIPQLAALLGDSDIDRPLRPEQLEALEALPGLFAIDRAGRRLLAVETARSVQVEELDAVPLDLAHLLPRHIEGGIELSTSRGCVHRCTFCSIIGRERWQARSAEGIFALLDRYQERFHALFGPDIPKNAFRVHISDDDFACDRERTIAFFRHLRQTPFRLSSVQVSIADLCRREGGRLLPEADHELLDAMAPACFADHGLPVPARDFVADHRSRTWSSFLQIGIESYADAELVRLGKGYTMAHVRAVAAELDRRGLHFDGYFILSNADTTARDLIEVLVGAARLKLRHPRHFHVRFPVVPRLVSYFPSASHRRRLRQGTADRLVLRDLARVPGHPEYDYPFVEHDEPADPWVESAVREDPFRDEALYTASLVRLREIWAARQVELSGEDAREGERLLRALDDLPRQLVFELLAEAREARHRGQSAPEAAAQAVAQALLGPPDRWLRAFQRHVHQTVPRLVVIPTWQCELRCNYCWIPKQDGRVMSARTLERCVDLLLSSRRPEVQLQFFGGEALLEWGLVRHGIEYGQQRARAEGKAIRFILSSNGWSLDEEKLDWLARHPVKLELSLDGDPLTQRMFRPARQVGLDSYENGIASRAEEIRRSGIPHEVIMVVHPMHAHRLHHNFCHIADLGFGRIQINVLLGRLWQPEHLSSFAENLHRIGVELDRRLAQGAPVQLINLENRPMPMRLNGEVTVDWDGTIYAGNAFLHETEHKERLRTGHLDDLRGFDRYWLDSPDNDFLLRHGYPPEMTANNLRAGAVLTSFLRHRFDQAQTASPPPPGG